MILDYPRRRRRPKKRIPGSTASVCDFEGSQFGDGLHVFGPRRMRREERLRP